MTNVASQPSHPGLSGSEGSSTAFDVVEWFIDTPLLLHALGALFVLLAFLPLSRPTDAWTSDEGAVRFQVELLATRGSWSTERPFANIDPEEITSPIHASTIVGDRYSPYTKQPLLPLLLVPLRNVVGEWGLVIPSLLGTLMAAVIGALIAGTFARRIRNLTLWILALATPLFFYGYTVLGHTLATALVAGAIVVVIRTGDRISLRWILGIVAIVLASLLRAEAVAYGIALAIAVSVAQPAVRWRVKGTLSALLAVSVLAAALANRSWAVLVGGASPVAEGQRILDLSRFLRGVFSGLVLTDFGTARVLTIVFMIVGGIVLLVLSIEREPYNVRLHWVLAATSVVGSILLLALIAVPIGGFLATMPFLLAGLVVLHRRDATDPSARLILVTSALFAAAVFATQEKGGGGLQWGGRYLMLALPALVPVAVLGLSSLLAKRASARSLVVGVLLFASVVLTLNAAVGLRTGREISATLSDQIAGLGHEVGGAADKPILVSSRTHIGRMAWRTVLDVDYLLIPHEEFEKYVKRMVDAEPARFGVVNNWTDDRAVLFDSLGYEAVNPDDEPFIIVVRRNR